METLRALQHHLPPIALDAIRLTNGLILLAILLVPLERLFALRLQKVLRAEFWTDIGYYFLSSLLPNRLLVLPIAALALGLQAAGHSSVDQWAGGLPRWARLAAAMLCAEIGFYWGHRWMHQSAWLWRFHAIHHSATRMDWLVNTRAHPVDLVFVRLCGYLPLYLLGLAHGAGNRVDWVPLAVALAGSMWGYFIHANLRWRFGWLEYVVATPAFHHWHHNNAGPEHRHKNYAPMFPWVDRLFGTFYLDRTKWPGEYGIDEPVERGLAGQLLQPIFVRSSPAPTHSVPQATRPPWLSSRRKAPQCTESTPSASMSKWICTPRVLRAIRAWWECPTWPYARAGSASRAPSTTPASDIPTRP